METTMTRDEMLTELRQRVCNVRFTKANGEQRDMYCTLSNIPEDKQPKGVKKAQPNDETIRVFDVNKQQWRSFKVDRVLSFV